MKFRDVKISIKISIALGVAVTACVLVGAIGFIMSVNLGNDIIDIGRVHLPGVYSLQVINEAQTAVEAEENSLLNRNITDKDREDSYKKVIDAWSRSDKAWKIYEPLEQSKAEAVAWKQFVPAWDEWKKDHEKFMILAKAFHATRSEVDYSNMSDQALKVNPLSFAKAESLLGRVIEINMQAADQTIVEAEGSIVFSRMMVLVALLIGVFISAVFGFIIIGSVTGPVAKGLSFAQKLAEGDLTGRIELDQKDELGQLAAALNIAADNLEDLMSNVIVSSQNLAQAVDQISSGNQNLSQRTSEQASSLEEIASTIEEATATINQNAENAQTANMNSEGTYKLAEEGGRVVGNAVASINDLNESSKKIGEIIAVINEISFQTNLLALNAAVEAARAGEQGRGFAVVAGEVRNLAQRSSSAAKEIESLIKDSLGKVDKGTALANKSGDSLKEIIRSIKQVSQVVSEIAAASEEQKQGINQINTAITEMDSMTQQNASLVEETAAAGEEMANQAQELLHMMEKFKIKENVKRDVYKEKHREVHLMAAEIKQGGDGGRKSKPAPVIHVAAGAGSQNLKQTFKEEGFEEF